jgi:hypothetical protein
LARPSGHYALVTLRGGLRKLALLIVSATAFTSCGSGSHTRSPADSTAIESTTVTPSVSISSESTSSIPDESQPATADVTPPTLQQVYAEIESKLLSHRGQILHVTSKGTNTLAPGAEYVSELYIDITNSVAREVVRGNSVVAGSNVWFAQSSTVIQSPGGNTRTVSPVACVGTTMLVGIALNCEEAELGSTTTVELAADRGVVLVISASVPQVTQLDPSCGGASCATIAFTKSYSRRVTLDPTTLLPTAVDEQGHMDAGNGLDYDGHTDVASEFVDPNTYDPGFFTPPITP